MKQIEVTDKAARIIKDLRAVDMEDLLLAKELVADSMSEISCLVQEGRDDIGIGVHTDGLLKAMYTLAEYNNLINVLSMEIDRDLNGYIVNANLTSVCHENM